MHRAAIQCHAIAGPAPRRTTRTARPPSPTRSRSAARRPPSRSTLSALTRRRCRRRRTSPRWRPPRWCRATPLPAFSSQLLMANLSGETKHEIQNELEINKQEFKKWNETNCTASGKRPTFLSCAHGAVAWAGLPRRPVRGCEGADASTAGVWLGLQLTAYPQEPRL